MLKDKIHEEMTASLKAGQTTDVKVLRFLLSQIQYAEIAKQKELTDQEVQQVLQKELKKRQEAIELFKKAGRVEIVADEEAQIITIKKYLPTMMPQEELEKMVDEVISMTQEKNMGKIIGLVMAKTKNKENGAVVARLVKQKLEQA